MDEDFEELEIDEQAQELFKPENKGFFGLLVESFKFFLLNLPAIATIVIPVFLVAEIIGAKVGSEVALFSNRKCAK